MHAIIVSYVIDHASSRGQDSVPIRAISDGKSLSPTLLTRKEGVRGGGQFTREQVATFSKEQEKIWGGAEGGAGGVYSTH